MSVKNKIYSTLLDKYFWLTVTVVFSFSRIATWLFPFDSDHWIFYYVGRRWVEGGTLYVDMWDHKSPLIFGFNGILHLIFGGNIVWHRIVFTIITIFGVYLFYKTAILLQKYLKKVSSMSVKVATIIFAFLASLSEFTNSGNNNENLGLVLILATLYLYLRAKLAKQNNYLPLVLASGLVAGFVFMLKANFSVLLIPIVLDLIVTQRKNIYRLISTLVAFALGSVAQLLVWSLYFKHVGTFKDFFIATFQFNSKYIKALGWDIHAPGIAVFIGILVLLLLFFAPFIVKSIQDFAFKHSPENLLIASISVSSLIFIVLAGTFYSHYFLFAIPYFCLVFSVTINKLFVKFGLRLAASLLIISVFLYLISLKQLYNSYFGGVASEAKNQTQAANYINNHTNKNDKVFAYVYGATFYRLASRDSGSRFVSASHPLIDYKYNFGYDFNKIFILDMENSETKYVVMSADKDDIYREQNPVLMRYFANNYHLEKQLEGYNILTRNN
jgi:4-amino-4-deoxy-L-arabinose transferase-like glycosyltransferase